MILINTLSLAMKFYKQPELYTQFLDVLNVIFTVFFTMEFVFKLGAFRFKVRVKSDFESTMIQRPFKIAPWLKIMSNCSV